MATDAADMTGTERAVTGQVWTPDIVPGDVRIAVGRAAGFGGGGTPVVAVHGITAHHRSFNGVARHATPPGGLLGVDVRGRGNSDKPATGYGMPQHAHDLVRVLDHYGIEQAIIAGHSMGAFVAAQTAMLYPDRVRGLVLLDGGWPRSEPDPSNEAAVAKHKAEAEAVQTGVMCAFSRLSMTFETPDAYLDFWFPGAGLTIEALPPDLADYYMYDIAQDAEGKWHSKCLLAAAMEDGLWTVSHAPTPEQLSTIKHPIAVVVAEEGFFPGSSALVSDEALATMKTMLDIRTAVRLAGASHYTMLMSSPYVDTIGSVITEFARSLA